jgi:hypothetical protein
MGSSRRSTRHAIPAKVIELEVDRQVAVVLEVVALGSSKASSSSAFSAHPSSWLLPPLLLVLVTLYRFSSS